MIHAFSVEQGTLPNVLTEAGLQDQQPPRLSKVPILVGLGDGQICSGRQSLLPRLDVAFPKCFQKGTLCIPHGCMLFYRYHALTLGGFVSLCL